MSTRVGIAGDTEGKHAIQIDNQPTREELPFDDSRLPKNLITIGFDIRIGHCNYIFVCEVRLKYILNTSEYNFGNSTFQKMILNIKFV